MHAVVNGALFGLVMGVFYSFRDGLWPGVLGGLLGGVIFGAIVGPRNAAQARRAGQATRDLSADDAKRARRAVHRGPAPDDPRVRRAAVQLAEQQREELMRTRRLGLVFFTLMGAVAVALAVTGTPWMFLGAAVFAALLVQVLWWPKHLEARRELLTAAAEGT